MIPRPPTTTLTDTLFPYPSLFRSNAMIQDIARALLESDVNVRVVGQLRQRIKERVNLEDAAAGTNRRKLIQRVVVEELTSMLNPNAEPYEMKKRSEEHTSELQSLMRISYAVLCLKNKKKKKI